MVVSSVDQIGDTLKRSARILAIACAAILCAALSWFVWQAWQMVWIMESVTSDQLDPEAAALILKQVEASRRQLEEDRTPSLDKLYPIASPETLNLVSGRWQIVEDWDDGLCWYSWGRSQREGKHELRILDISDHLMGTSIQQAWESEPQILRNKITLPDKDGTPTSHLWIHKTLVVFDVDGPRTFLSQSATEFYNNQFHGDIRGFPTNVANGFVDRGIVVPDNDRLYLFWAKGDEAGQKLPHPEWVPLRPRCVGTHLVVLRRFPDDWKYPPDGVDIAAVQAKFESSTPRYIGDSRMMEDSAFGTPRSKNLIPLSDIRSFDDVDDMPPKMREIYDQSLKQFENP